MTIDERIRSGEATFVNIASAIAPWLAPLAPAYMTYSHLMSSTFEFPLFIAVSVSATVEMLGFATISTIISFWSYNKRKLAEYKRAPVGTVLFSFAMYLSVILLMNVFLDAADIFNSPSATAWITVLAKALLTLLSVPAAILLATRTQHKEMLDSLKREKEERRSIVAAKSTTRAQSASPAVLDTKSGKKKQFLADLENGRIQAVLEQTGALLTAETLAEIYGVSVRTAFRWLKSIQ